MILLRIAFVLFLSLSALVATAAKGLFAVKYTQSISGTCPSDSRTLSGW